jgi:4-hydroxythreonine-4-phosphate dehydrogenase
MKSKIKLKLNNHPPILIVAGEPYSIFSEILYKAIKNYKSKKPIVVIGSYSLIKKQIYKLNYNLEFNLLSNDFKSSELMNKKINIINIEFDYKKIFDKISINSKKYIEKSFEVALKLLKTKKIAGIINGPISKSDFLEKKFFGITEYLAHKLNISNFAMLIYNEKTSVSPVTTHIPLKHVSKKISKRKIISTVELIKDFYKIKLKRNVKIAITGVNPHCESNREKDNEEKKIIIPAIRYLQKKYTQITGPVSADTVFIKANLKKFDVIVGMYHDQVLGPLKTLYNFDAINITLGLPFIRISPDHGTGNDLLGKKKSSAISILKAIKFLDKI